VGWVDLVGGGFVGEGGFRFFWEGFGDLGDAYFHWLFLILVLLLFSITTFIMLTSNHARQIH
jgi:hypothetical protein